MLSLSGRTCVFAGGTGKIGSGAVKALAESGMNVVLVTHNPDAAEKLKNALRDAPGIVMAVSNANGDAAPFVEAERVFGSVDVVINSTGGLNPLKPVLEISDEELEKKLVHQVIGAFSFFKEAVPYLKKSRAPRMILTATAGAVNGFPGENAADSIARGAVITMTKVFARAFETDGITVNCIARSAMIDDHQPRTGSYESLRDAVPLTGLQRLGTAEEYGALVSYIASEESAHTTGCIFDLCGGILN